MMVRPIKWAVKISAILAFSLFLLVCLFFFFFNYEIIGLDLEMDINNITFTMYNATKLGHKSKFKNGRRSNKINIWETLYF